MLEELITITRAIQADRYADAEVIFLGWPKKSWLRAVDGSWRAIPCPLPLPGDVHPEPALLPGILN
jgi:hypothetical protein